MPVCRTLNGAPARLSGLGEPCFDKLEAMLAHAMLSIPSTKGFVLGSGFEGTKMRGSGLCDSRLQRGRTSMRMPCKHTLGACALGSAAAS